MLFDPANHWQLVACEYERGWPGSTMSFTATLESRSESGIPIPTKLVTRQDNWQSERVFDLAFPSSPPDDAEFRLTAFGLEDIAQLADQEIPPQRNWWI